MMKQRKRLRMGVDRARNGRRRGGTPLDQFSSSKGLGDQDPVTKARLAQKPHDLNKLNVNLKLKWEQFDVNTKDLRDQIQTTEAYGKKAKLERDELIDRLIKTIEWDQDSNDETKDNITRILRDLWRRRGYKATRALAHICLLYTSPSPRDKRQSRMPSSA